MHGGSYLNATTSEMGCTACHNPHGNGNYRILNPIPEAGTTQTKASIPVNVEDATFDPARTRNYTVIQVPAPSRLGLPRHRLKKPPGCSMRIKC